MLNWSDRGGGGYGGQQALAANLFEFGASWAGLNAHEDLRSAEFLATRSEVDPKRVAAMGLSVGGYRTWQTAALSDRIAVGVSVCWMATRKQTSGFWGIGAIVAANRVSRDLHVRPNVAGLGIPQMAQRPVSEDLGV